MNIPHNSQGPDRAGKRQVPSDLGHQARERLHRGGEHVERAKQTSARDAARTVERGRAARAEADQRVSPDRIELSAGAQAFEAGEVGPSRESAAERAARVAHLRELAQQGQLNTPERAHESAGRLLESE